MKSGRTYRESITAMEEFFKMNYTCDYHVCKEVWKAVVGEALVCEREPENTSDQYAVACEKGTFALKAVMSLFAVFVMGGYTVASVSVECKYVKWRAL